MHYAVLELLLGDNQLLVMNVIVVVLQLLLENNRQAVLRWQAMNAVRRASSLEFVDKPHTCTAARRSRRAASTSCVRLPQAGEVDVDRRRVRRSAFAGRPGRRLVCCLWRCSASSSADR